MNATLKYTTNYPKYARIHDDLRGEAPTQAPQNVCLRLAPRLRRRFVDRDDDVDVQDFVEHVYEWKSKLAEVRAQGCQSAR